MAITSHVARAVVPRVVTHPAMSKAYDFVTRAAATELLVLSLGETGVGEDVIARTNSRALAASGLGSLR